jgi:hypothetical protein
MYGTLVAVVGKYLTVVGVATCRRKSITEQGKEQTSDWRKKEIIKKNTTNLMYRQAAELKKN